MPAKTPVELFYDRLVTCTAALTLHDLNLVTLPQETLDFARRTLKTADQFKITAAKTDVLEAIEHHMLREAELQTCS